MGFSGSFFTNQYSLSGSAGFVGSSTSGTNLNNPYTNPIAPTSSELKQLLKKYGISKNLKKNRKISYTTPEGFLTYGISGSRSLLGTRFFTDA